MKITIIPDVHNKFVEAEGIINREYPSKVIFLGDYFDDYDDSPEIAYQVALWLRKSLTNPDRIHLIGNHDLSYVTNGDYKCAGWDGAKQMFINKVKIPWNGLRPYWWAGDWLCTHAGLSYDFYKAYGTGTPNNTLQHYSNDPELRFRLWNCSPYRGGRDAHSGIVWCDYNEFIDIPDTKQIFGHTKGGIRHGKDDGGEHYCIDTCLENYAVYEHGEMKIHETNI